MLENTADPLEKVDPSHTLHHAFAHAATGLAVADLRGRLLECNSAFAAMAGRTPAELHGIDTVSLLHPDDRQQSNEAMRRLLAGETPAFVLEQRYVTPGANPDANLTYLRISVSLLRDRNQRPVGIVTVAEDLTFVRLAERTLIEGEKLATGGRLTASIAHELNNPLESITNLLFLIAHSDDLAQSRAYALHAEQEMQRVSQIATQTLRFFRQQSAPAPVQLTTVVDGALALFAGKLRSRNIVVVKRYADCEDAAIAYDGELRQVFVNLIGNALDAMGDAMGDHPVNDHGVLRIDVRPSRCWRGAGEEGVRVVVSDSGSGIPRHLLKRVFDPFVSTKEQRGTGLGLWIAREIIRRHGGTLKVRSSTAGPRRGTAMSVFLPTHAADEFGMAA